MISVLFLIWVNFSVFSSSGHKWSPDQLLLPQGQTRSSSLPNEFPSVVQQLGNFYSNNQSKEMYFLIHLLLFQIPNGHSRNVCRSFSLYVAWEAIPRANTCILLLTGMLSCALPSVQVKYKYYYLLFVCVFTCWCQLSVWHRAMSRVLAAERWRTVCLHVFQECTHRHRSTQSFLCLFARSRCQGDQPGLNASNKYLGGFGGGSEGWRASCFFQTFSISQCSCREMSSV